MADKFLFNDSSLKSKIIFLLANERDLSAKQIHNQLKKHENYLGSYQALHKTIASMLEQNIVTKKGKSYQLNSDWIENLSKFSEHLKEHYSEKGNQPITKDFQGTTKWFFNDYTDAILAWVKLFSSKILVGKNSSKGLALARHAYWPLKFKFIDFNLLVNMVKNNEEAYVIVQHDTPFDKWIKKQYLSAGVKAVKLGQKIRLEKDLMIHGEYLLEIKFSKETQKRLDKIYLQTKNLGDLLKHYTKEAFSKKTDDIEITITRNPQLAKLMINQIIEKYFGEKSK